MNLKDAYLTQYRICVKKNLPVDMDGHYQTHFEFGGEPVYVNPDGSPVVSYRFSVTGCVKNIKGKFIHKDLLPVYGRICTARVKGFLYKYLLFLRCDGIEDPDLLKLYVLHCLCKKMVYYTRDKSTSKVKWVQYTPDYKDVSKMVDALIQSVLKKDIDEHTRTQFMTITTCKINPLKPGMVKKTRRERFKDARIGAGKATDLMIKSKYDPTLTDEENSQIIGVSVRKLQMWKAEHPDWWESKKERVRRLYDWSKSEVENARLIGVDRKTIRKYKPELEEVEEVEPVKEVEDDDSWVDKMLEQFDY